MKKEVSQIKNRIKRKEVYARVKADKKRTKKVERTKRQKEAQELGEEAPPKQVGEVVYTNELSVWRRGMEIRWMGGWMVGWNMLRSRRVHIHSRLTIPFPVASFLPL